MDEWPENFSPEPAASTDSVARVRYRAGGGTPAGLMQGGSTEAGDEP